MNAQEKEHTLDARQQGMVGVSALTASGNMEKLKPALAAALDAGVTVNEIKEALVQLYAYCGFPRSLNALAVFKNVLDDRASKGIHDEQGRPAVIGGNNAGDQYERGRKVLEELTKMPQAKPAPGFGEFAPRIDAFLKTHLFADIFDSDVLSFRQRELVTISALASLSGVESQLAAHINMGINTGLTKDQLLQVFDVVARQLGKQYGDNAKAVLAKIK